MATSTGRALAFRLLALFGIVLSSYALYVEHRVSRQKAGLASEEEGLFVALCDLGTWASCSDVLTSETSRLFGPPNALMGVIFYTAVLLYPSFTFVPFREYLLLAAVSFSCALTVYLGSVLYRMGDFCVLCVSTYVINWTVLVLAVREVRAASRRTTKKTK